MVNTVIGIKSTMMDRAGQEDRAMEEYSEDIKYVGDPGSLSFLGGNMAMGAIHARLYRISGLEVYRERLEEL